MFWTPSPIEQWLCSCGVLTLVPMLNPTVQTDHYVAQISYIIHQGVFRQPTPEETDSQRMSDYMVPDITLRFYRV